MSLPGLLRFFSSSGKSFRKTPLMSTISKFGNSILSNNGVVFIASWLRAAVKARLTMLISFSTSGSFSESTVIVNRKAVTFLLRYFLGFLVKSFVMLRNPRNELLTAMMKGDTLFAKD